MTSPSLAAFKSRLARDKYEVAVWWNERIAAGCQLKFINNTRAHVDWKGTDGDPWKEAVAKEVLWRDFIVSTSVFMAYNRFCECFKSVAKHPEATIRNTTVSRRGVSYVEKRSFVKFGPLPTVPVPV